MREHSRFTTQPRRLPKEWGDAVMSENARAFYRLPPPAETVAKAA